MYWAGILDSTMDPISTIPYPEFFIAEKLPNRLQKKDGYTILLPIGRQEKAIDLVLARKSDQGLRCLTIQVKSSRPYEISNPRQPRLRFGFWFNRFKVEPEADWYFLFCLCPNVERGEKAAGTERSWWAPIILAFTNQEMK